MSPDVRRRILVGVCLVLALVCVVAATRPDPAASGTTTPGAATAGWSVRRVPAPVVEFVAGQRLTESLTTAVSSYDACVVVDTSGRIVGLGSASPLVPASTLKVLTALGALDRLPEDHRFTTQVRTPPGADVGAPGQLFLVGGGDPLLGTDDWRARREADPMRRGTPTTSLEELADAVFAAGVRSVPGGVVGVGGPAGDPTFLDTWDASYRSAAIGPLGTLTANSGFRSDGSRVDDGALYAAEELTRLLAERGVEVGSASATSVPPDTAPDGPVIAEVASPPLAEVVGVMLATSDNLAAEFLVRAVAHEAASDTGAGVEPGEDATRAGLRLMGDSFAALGLPLEGVVQVDGSGLSTQNRVTCDVLDAALAIAETEPRFAAVREGMAVAGELGTLAPRLGGTPLAGSLFAKTGTLPGVTGLAGWMTVGPELRFAFVANGAFSQNDALFIREDIARILAVHPDSPPADTLVPAP